MQYDDSTMLTGQKFSGCNVEWGEIQMPVGVGIL